MILISHRGNLDSKNPDRENSPLYLLEARSKGYDVECDIRYICGNYYLGHDRPQYPLDLNETDEHWWFHAKDGTTLRQALKDNLHVFYDDSPNTNYCLTSKNYIWHHDGHGLIYVTDKDGIIGMCSDYVGEL